MISNGFPENPKFFSKVYLCSINIYYAYSSAFLALEYPPTIVIILYFKYNKIIN